MVSITALVPRTASGDLAACNVPPRPTPSVSASPLSKTRLSKPMRAASSAPISRPSEGQLACDAFGHEARQALQRADIGSHCHVDLAYREARVGVRVAHVAGGHDVDSATDAGTLDGGDHGLAAALDGAHAVCMSAIMCRGFSCARRPHRHDRCAWGCHGQQRDLFRRRSVCRGRQAPPPPIRDRSGRPHLKALRIAVPPIGASSALACAGRSETMRATPASSDSVSDRARGCPWPGAPAYRCRMIRGVRYRGAWAPASSLNLAPPAVLPVLRRILAATLAPVHSQVSARSGCRRWSPDGVAGHPIAGRKRKATAIREPGCAIEAKLADALPPPTRRPRARIPATGPRNSSPPYR